MEIVILVQIITMVVVAAAIGIGRLNTGSSRLTEIVRRMPLLIERQQPCPVLMAAITIDRCGRRRVATGCDV